MSVSGGDLGEWVGPERTRDLAGVDETELRRQLRTIAHELTRRRGQEHQPYVWHLPDPGPYTTSRAYQRGGKVELSVNDVTVVTRLDDSERWAFIAWLIAQDREEEAPGTT